MIQSDLTDLGAPHRVVFLDIDGVLNHLRMAEAMDQQHVERGCPNRWTMRHGGTCDCFQLSRQIDPACVARLNSLLDRSGAVVVLSTSWRRLLDAEAIDHVLSEHGFTGVIVGQTPDLANEPGWHDWYRERYPLDRSHPVSGTSATRWGASDRGWEILAWLWPRRHLVEQFAILDDCGDMAWLRPQLVHTSDMHGLDDQDVEVALQLLGKSERAMMAIREESSWWQP